MGFRKAFNALPRFVAIVGVGALCTQTVQAQDSKDAVASLLGEYCTKCHNFDDYAGGIDLDGIGGHNLAEFPDIGEKVIKRLRAGMMPPKGESRP